MTSEELKNILSKHHLRPQKRMGQNFLIEPTVLAKIVQTAQLSKDDLVLEIGPGLGVLTTELIARAGRVVAVEKDSQLTEILKTRLSSSANLEIINQDILKLDLTSFKKYKVVANLPYYITSPLIRFLLERDNQPQLVVLLVQKEVAQRICAQPPRMSILANSVQLYGQPTINQLVSADCFYPKPKVDSAILEIRNLQKPQINIDLFFKVLKIGFSCPRKTLANNLSRGLVKDKLEIEKILIENKIEPQRRAQTLTLEEWQKIVSLVE